MYAETGIVHQEVDRARWIFESLGNPIDVCPVGEVGGKHLDLSAEASEFIRHRVESHLVSCDENEVVSLMCELAGKFGSNAGCAPRHERYSHAAYDTVLEVNFVHRSLLRPAPEAKVS